MQFRDAGYLSAMIDGEGSVTPAGGLSWQVCIYNGTVEIIDECCRCLDELGVEHRRLTHNPNGPRPIEKVVIAKHAAIMQLAKYVRLAHPIKAERLEIAATPRPYYGSGPRTGVELRA